MPKVLKPKSDYIKFIVVVDMYEYKARICVYDIKYQNIMR
jgi:hypothetical protein